MEKAEGVLNEKVVLKLGRGWKEMREWKRRRKNMQENWACKKNQTKIRGTSVCNTGSVQKHEKNPFFHCCPWKECFVRFLMYGRP